VSAVEDGGYEAPPVPASVRQQRLGNKVTAPKRLVNAQTSPNSVMVLSEMWTLMLSLPSSAMTSPVDLFLQVLLLSLTQSKAG